MDYDYRDKLGAGVATQQWYNKVLDEQHKIVSARSGISRLHESLKESIKLDPRFTQSAFGPNPDKALVALEKAFLMLNKSEGLVNSVLVQIHRTK